MLTTSSNFQITEIFASVQGETSYAGFPSTFIRLAACNLRCTWCDTPYSFGRGETWSFSSILEKVKEYGCQYVCITGGEPLLQPAIHLLMKELCDQGYRLSIETGGSLDTAMIDPRVKIILDIKCPGSGMESKNFWANLPHLREFDEVKFVLAHKEDYLYAKSICQKYHLFERTENILLSPVHQQLEPQTLIEWILEDRLPVRLNLQMHKYIWDPLTRGV